MIYKIINDYIIPNYFHYKNKDGKIIKNDRLHIILNLKDFIKIHDMTGRGGTKSTNYSRTVIFYIWLLKWMNCLSLRSFSGKTMQQSTGREFKIQIDKFCLILAKAYKEVYNLKNSIEEIYKQELAKWDVHVETITNNYIKYYRDPNNKNYYQEINLSGLQGNIKSLKRGESVIKGIKAPCEGGYYGIILYDEVQQVFDKEKINQASLSIRAPADKFVTEIFLLNSDNDAHNITQDFKKYIFFDEVKLRKGIALEYIKKIKFKDKTLPTKKILYRVANVYTYYEILKEVAPKLLEEAEIANTPDNSINFNRDFLGIPYTSTDNLYYGLTNDIKIDFEWDKFEIDFVSFGIDIGSSNSNFSIVFKVWYYNSQEKMQKIHTPYMLTVNKKHNYYYENLNKNNNNIGVTKNIDVLKLAINFITGIYLKHPRLNIINKPWFYIDDNTQGWIRLFKQALLSTNLIYNDGRNVLLAVKPKILNRINIQNNAMLAKIYTYGSDLIPLFEEMNNIKMDKKGFNRIDGNDDSLNADEYSWTPWLNKVQHLIGKARKDIK